MKQVLKNTIIFLTIAVVLFNSGRGFLKPEKAEAILVECPACSKLWKDVIDAAERAARWVKEDLNRGIRDIVAKRIIDYLVDETVRWIQGGGKPKFVTDWQGFLRDAGNIAFDQVVKDVGAARICEPFAFNVRLSLLPTPRFAQRLDCTLDRVVSNINAFYDDFRNGGWLAYNEAWQPQNNFYGQTILIQDEIVRRYAEQQRAAQNEALAGRGFLDVKRCVERDPVEVQICNSELPTEAEQAACRANARCIQEEAINPGAAVGETVISAINADKDWAANIQSWTAVLVNAVINRILKEGVGGILRVTTGGPDRTDYQAPETVDIINSEFDLRRAQLIGPLRPIIAAGQDVLQILDRAITAQTTAIQNLQTLQVRNCPIAPTEIPTAQSQLATFSNQKTQIQPALDDLNRLKSRIEQAENEVDLARRSAENDTIMARYGLNDPQNRGALLDGTLHAIAESQYQQAFDASTQTNGRVQTCLLGGRPQTGGQ
ncbi:hypothetical protein HYV91_03820 [Candidatus Wolfebacteria bacterium]|nr:hypothetical protein [Candidatus Wolfebacteria bacterium]